MTSDPSPYDAGYAHGRAVALGELSAEAEFPVDGYSVAELREFRRGLVEGFYAAMQRERRRTKNA